MKRYIFFDFSGLRRTLQKTFPLYPYDLIALSPKCFVFVFFYVLWRCFYINIYRTYIVIVCFVLRQNNWWGALRRLGKDLR